MRPALISTRPLLNFSVLLSSSLLAGSLIFAQAPAPLLVAAAADLARAQPALSKSFTKVSVRYAFGASGMLARQIENGAPYDVFLCANAGFVRQLVDQGKLVRDSVVVYAYGRLGLWSRSGRFRDPKDLLEPSVRHVAIANPLHAPYGIAARDALRKLGLWEKLEGKLVYGENVQQALQYAESGNADAAITAWSLVFDRGGVLLPSAWHADIVQMGAMVAGSPNPAGAREFLGFLTGPEGRKLLEKFGFQSPMETHRP